jgi:hypothetical protein
MDRLRAREPAQEIAKFLRSELSGHFGLDPKYSKPEVFARRLVDWYTSGVQSEQRPASP